MTDLAGLARTILDRSAYMTLATADADGRPWASPVWFAWDGRRTFWWVSMPDTVHSRNIDARSDVAIVVFDTGAPVGQAQAVYVRANARRDDDAGGLETFSRKSVASGLRTWTAADTNTAGGVRLYRADAGEISILDATTGHGRDERVPVSSWPGA